MGLVGMIISSVVLASSLEVIYFLVAIGFSD